MTPVKLLESVVFPDTRQIFLFSKKDSYIMQQVYVVSISGGAESVWTTSEQASEQFEKLKNSGISVVTIKELTLNKSTLKV